MKAYRRACADTPQYAQDYPTYILIGRWIHLYSPAYDLWFPPGKAFSKDPPQRDGCAMEEITLEEWLRAVGEKRGKQEIWEDRLGIRLSWVAKKLKRVLPLKILKRLASQDTAQDWFRYDREAEKPRIGIHLKVTSK